LEFVGPCDQHSIPDDARFYEGDGRWLGDGWMIDADYRTLGMSRNHILSTLS
jgi:hypothetical protein